MQWQYAVFVLQRTRVGSALLYQALILLLLKLYSLSGKVLDYLYDTSKDDLGLSKLDIIVEPRTGLSSGIKNEVRTRQTVGTEIKCDISGRFYSIEDLEYCHIEAHSFGIFNDSQVNEKENIRLAHRRYNRMMGTMNYNDFKKSYESNPNKIDEQLNLAA